MEALLEDPHCRAGLRCIALTPDGPAATSKPDSLCHPCIQRLQEQYDLLPEIRRVLELYKGGIGGASGEAKVSGTQEPAIPLNLHVLDLISEIEALIHYVHGVPIADVIRWSDGIRRALDIGKVYKKADGVIGLSRKWTRRMSPCPKCQLRTLGSFAGSDSIQCTNCGGVMTRDEYARVTIIQSKEPKGKSK